MDFLMLGIIWYIVLPALWIAPSVIMIVIPNTIRAFLLWAGCIAAGVLLAIVCLDGFLPLKWIVALLFIHAFALMMKYLAIRMEKAGRIDMAKLLPLLGLLGPVGCIFWGLSVH